MENVKVIWMPKAKELEFMAGGLVQRSYEVFIQNGRQDTLSRYSDMFIVVTFQADPSVHQLILTPDEIRDLPVWAQEKVKRMLAGPPIIQGTVITPLGG